ncbi:glycosyltransferase family 2 protein [Agromyces larvae]|uniref:Glycosyltransferase family 2 protein n=1 Tax=Agromyces larvae TaxID=2929802 RepID=A0ABY4BZ12_9MICO|nr:glycosyltransferase family 2 protein [Agromyces larvae]UOE44483.1 glycosyltransferase family 2 protein [Agromyces larvae]
MPASAESRVAVVTVSYNSSAQLAAFLTSVGRQTPAPARVVIVDNDSADLDETRTVAAEFGAHVVALEHNVGYGGAINAGVLALGPEIDYVLISNPDIALHDGAIAILTEAGERDQGVGAVGPRILNEDGTTYPSARSIPSVRTGVGHAVLGHPWPANPWTRAYRGEHADTGAARDAGWLSGSCVLVRRSAFDAIGGFDESYFMYFEDVDLGYRLGKAGWRNRYEPSASATHIGGVSTRTESARMLRAHHESAIRFINRKYAAAWLAPLRWTLTLGLRTRLRLMSRRAR